MKKALLRYFTGTGNSLKVMNICKDKLKDKGYETVISSILEENKINENEFEIFGFCFPVFALGLPRIVYKYLAGMNELEFHKKTFLLVTGGDKDNNGWALSDGISMLNIKGYDTAYTDLITMPNNWSYEHMNSKEETDELFKHADDKITVIIDDFINGKTYYKPFNFYKFGKIRSKIIYELFKNLGIKRLWKIFRINDNCIGCGLCERICPTKSIMLIDRKPVWKNTCEQCTRCINFCPQNAISLLGMKKDKIQYHEPGFKP
jgi:ferredoxin